MSIRRNLIACLAVFIALGGASFAATHHSASTGCYPPGSTTIAQDAVGRFYSTVPRRSSGVRKYWYVCAFTQGQPRKLPFWDPIRGTRGPGPVLPADRNAAASGRYVAFFGFDCCLGWVKVFDMVTGREKFSALPSRFQRSSPASLVLRADGGVAWVVPGPRPAPRGSGGGTGSIWYVKRHDSTGTATVDAGTGIGPHSLAAGGSWLYWTRNVGSPPGPRSAPFH